MSRYIIIIFILFLSSSGFAVDIKLKPTKTYRQGLKSESGTIPIELKAIIEKQLINPEGVSYELSQRQNLEMEITLNYESRVESVTKIYEVKQGQARLDLAQDMSEAKAFFDIKFNIASKDVFLNKLKVFFIPYAQRPENIKPLCNKVSDITGFYHKILKRGLKLKLQDNQYLKLLAGQYIFVHPSKGKLNLALLEINDSRKKHSLECY